MGYYSFNESWRLYFLVILVIGSNKVPPNKTYRNLINEKHADTSA